MVRTRHLFFVLLTALGCLMIIAMRCGSFCNKTVSVRLLSSTERECIQGGGGGSSNSSSSSGKGGSSSTVKYDKVHLSNVPYYNQTNGISKNWRSRYYCGLASLFMVRHAGSSYTSSSYRVNCSQAEIDKYMLSIDNALKSGSAVNYFDSLYYNVAWGHMRSIDIAGSATANKTDVYDGGLLYDDPLLNDYWDCTKLFSVTSSVLSELYTSTLWNVPANPVKIPSPTHVTKANIYCFGSSEALTKIWNQIRDNHEPVVTIMDSGCTKNLYAKNFVSGMTSKPILHYNVVIGIKEDSSGKYFEVYDPWYSKDYNGGYRTYKADDYVRSMYVNSNVTPQWVYNYADNNHSGLWYDDGCYVMFINEL